MNSQNIIEKIKNSGLIGRSGSGFPTGLKWEMVKKAQGKKKYIICNASEGEPGTFKDGFILENHPQELIKGIEIALKTLNASLAYIYLRKDYYQKFKKNLEKLIGSLPIRLFKKAGGYLCGEETTLIESLEGKRQEPRSKPPYPPQKGLWGCPTLVNNVETLYCVALIDGDEYKGNRFYSLSGVKNPGVYDLSEKSSVKQVLKITNNWPRFKFFVQAGGGASGRILSEKELNQKVEGTGSIIVYDQKKTKPIYLMKKWADFFFNQNCGKCVPCREGVYRLKQALKQSPIDKKTLNDLLFSLKETSFCPLGRCAAVPFLSLLKMNKL